MATSSIDESLLQQLYADLEEIQIKPPSDNNNSYLLLSLDDNEDEEEEDEEIKRLKEQLLQFKQPTIQTTTTTLETEKKQPDEDEDWKLLIDQIQQNNPNQSELLRPMSALPTPSISSSSSLMNKSSSWIQNSYEVNQESMEMSLPLERLDDSQLRIELEGLMDSLIASIEYLAEMESQVVKPALLQPPRTPITIPTYALILPETPDSPPLSPSNLNPINQRKIPLPVAADSEILDLVDEDFNESSLLPRTNHSQNDNSRLEESHPFSQSKSNQIDIFDKKRDSSPKIEISKKPNDGNEVKELSVEEKLEHLMSEMLIAEAKERKKTLQNIENQYELEVKSQYVINKQLIEEEKQRQQTRKLKRQEMIQTALREKKSTIIQKYYRRHVCSKKYQKWLKQKKLKEEERIKFLEMEAISRELKLMYFEDQSSRRIEDYHLKLQILRRQREQREKKSSNLIQKTYRGSRQRRKYVVQKLEASEMKLMFQMDLFSVSLRLLPSFKSLRLKQEASKKKSQQPFKINELAVPYEKLRLTEKDRQELLNRSIFPSEIVFRAELEPLPSVQVAKVSKPRSSTLNILDCLTAWQGLKSSKGDQNESSVEKKFLYQLLSSSLDQPAEQEEKKEEKEIESLDLAVEGIQNLNFLEHYSSLKRLILNVNSIHSLDEIDNYANQLKHLENLSISDNKLIQVNSLNSPKLSSLLILNLDSNRLEFLNLKALTSLHTLSCNCNQLKSFPVLASPFLFKLELYYNNICSLPPKEVLELIPSITYLNLGKNQIEDISGDCFDGTPLLQNLILSQNKIKKFPNKLHLPILHSFWLNGNQIQSFPPKFNFKDNYFLPQLRKLYLQDNQLNSLWFSSNGNSLVSSEESIFSIFPLLQEVDLSFNQLQSLDNLEGLSFCSFLQNIKLNDNPFVELASSMAPTTPAAVAKAIVDWITNKFLFIKVFNGEAISIANRKQKYLYRNATSDRKREGIALENQAYYQQFLQLLQALKAESDDLLVKNRRKLMKKSSPIEEYHLQLENEKSLALLAFFQQKKLQSFGQKGEDRLLKQKDTFNTGRTLKTSSSYVNPTANFLKLMEDTLQELKAQEEEEKRVQELRSKEEEVKKSNAQLAKGIISLQAAYRGYRFRKRIKSYLNSIQYEDTEIDAILNENAADDGLFNMDDLLSLEEEFGLNSSKSSTSFKAKPESRAKPAAVIHPDQSAPSLAYGDHIRKRNNITVGEITNQNGFFLDLPTVKADSGIADQERPIITPRSAASSAKTIEGSEQQPRSTYSKSEMTPFRSPRERKEAAIANDWGIENPELLARIMQRNKKMQNLLHAKEKREQEKDSTVRYQKFLKQQAKFGTTTSFSYNNNHNNHSHQNPSSNSSVQGNRIYQTRTHKNGKSTRNPMVVPAWMASSTQFDNKEEEN